MTQPKKAPIVYDLLSEEELDDTLVQTMKAQQMDHYIHTLNAERYASMLPTLEEGSWKERMAGLLAETQSRIVEVESIIRGVEPQMPPAVRRQAAAVRLKAREDAAREIRKA